MARPLRVFVPGGVYHLIARGNAGDPVYRDAVDYLHFLETATATFARFGWLCHGYCLMENHYHLVVETPQPNLDRGMRQLNGLHAQRFNRRHGRFGHVFHARYRSILVEKEFHLLTLCRYVVLNPVRARICRDPAGYRWSSYLATAGIAPPEPFLTVDWILGQFGKTRRAAQEGYRRFIVAGLGAADHLDVRGERFGTGPFLRARLGSDPPLAEIPRVQVEPLRRPLDDIFATGTPTPIATAYRHHGYALREIAEHLGCHYSTVSRRLRREEGMRDCKT